MSELRDGIRLFLDVQGKTNFLVKLNDEIRFQSLLSWQTYFDQINKLKLTLQDRKIHFLIYQDNLRGLMSKLQNWRCKIDLGNIIMFEKFCEMTDFLTQKGIWNDCITEQANMTGRDR